MFQNLFKQSPDVVFIFKHIFVHKSLSTFLPFLLDDLLNGELVSQRIWTLFTNLFLFLKIFSFSFLIAIQTHGKNKPKKTLTFKKENKITTICFCIHTQLLLSFFPSFLPPFFPSFLPSFFLTLSLSSLLTLFLFSLLSKTMGPYY